MVRNIPTRFTALVLIFFVFCIGTVIAQVVSPEGPTELTITNSSRGTENVSGFSVQAQAGNVTGMIVFQERITQAWQAYYGNITGNISLEDSSGNTFYAWEIARPEGEIFAVNSSLAPRWGDIYCLNVSQNGTSAGPAIRPDGSAQDFNWTQVEQAFGINDTDLDGLNETYNEFYTDTDGISIAGDIFAQEDGCSMATPYTNSSDLNDWEQLLFSDNNTLIFASIIRDDQFGYENGTTVDFQMMVLENGHTENADITTTYHFYVELT